MLQDFSGFDAADFEVFAIPGLDERMEALKSQVRPKFQQLGNILCEYLSQILHREMFPHVARHARRTVNPPQDSWVAFSHDKRGYKKHPHFQVGLWETHAFIHFGVISESTQRQRYSNELLQHSADIFKLVPPNYVWIPDHTNPDAIPAGQASREKLAELAKRLPTRQGELLVGLNLPVRQVLEMSGSDFVAEAKRCFATLVPLYHMAMGEVELI